MSVGPNSKGRCPYKTKAEGGLRQRDTQRRRPKEDGDRDWSYTAIAKKDLEPPEGKREGRILP